METVNYKAEILCQSLRSFVSEEKVWENQLGNKGPATYRHTKEKSGTEGEEKQRKQERVGIL